MTNATTNGPDAAKAASAPCIDLKPWMSGTIDPSLAPPDGSEQLVADVETLSEMARTEEPTLGPISLSRKWATLALVVLPFVGLGVAIAMIWHSPFSWVYIALMIGLYMVSGLGITIGYHRLFTHRAFKTNPFMTYLIGAAASMAVQGPVIEWAAVHRRHHQHSDDDLDPHSPHLHGDGLRGVVLGFWHSHIGWLFKPHYTGLARYVPDLIRDRTVVLVNAHYPWWILAGLVIPAAIGGAVTQTWWGALLGFIWGGLVRLALVHHITWSINSVCHIWGSRTYKSNDESRNNPIFGVLGFGEGWHNNHHAFPASARHGLAWWQFDLSYLLIKAMEKLGLASDVKVPSRERLDAKRRRPAA